MSFITSFPHKKTQVTVLFFVFFFAAQHLSFCGWWENVHACSLHSLWSAFILVHKPPTLRLQYQTQRKGTKLKFLPLMEFPTRKTGFQEAEPH